MSEVPARLHGEAGRRPSLCRDCREGRPIHRTSPSQTIWKSSVGVSNAVDLIVDFQLERYLTPWLLRCLWGTWVAIASLIVLISGLNVMVTALDFSKETGNPARGGGFAPQRAWGWIERMRSTPTGSAVIDCIFTTIGVVLLLVSIRITCEAIVVIFNIADDLKTVRRQGISIKGRGER